MIFSPLSPMHKILLAKPRAEEMLAMHSSSFFFNMIYVLIALHCVFIAIALGEVEVCFSLILMLLNTTDKHYELNNEHKVTEGVYSEWTASGPCSTL